MITLSACNGSRDSVYQRRQEWKTRVNQPPASNIQVLDYAAQRAFINADNFFRMAALIGFRPVDMSTFLRQMANSTLERSSFNGISEPRSLRRGLFQVSRDSLFTARDNLQLSLQGSITLLRDSERSFTNREGHFCWGIS